MSSIERALSGDALVVALQQEPGAATHMGRLARTLIKNGPLRATLVTLAPGGEIPDHHAEGPITVQPLQGQLRFTALGVTHDIGPGQLLSLGTGVHHALASTDGATFLLTVAKVETPAAPQQP
ncbi:MAG: cupin domain-containing protein [Gemmatimonadota bacterium]